MYRVFTPLTAAAAFFLITTAVGAQEKLKIGLIYSLSGPPAVLGQQSKNGFELALKDLGGKMGGRDVELFIADDELKPDVAIQKVRGLIDRDRVDFVVGPIFSNVLQAIHKPIMDAGMVLISTNAGASSFAGSACNPNFFVTSYQNDQIFETLGKVAQDRGYKRVYALVPNYQAGKDAIAGFKHAYKGELVEEFLVPLSNLDFQSELSKIGSLKPDALFTFMPGGLGISFIKQFNQAGLNDRIPIFPHLRPTRQLFQRCRTRHSAFLVPSPGRLIPTIRKIRNSSRPTRLPTMQYLRRTQCRLMTPPC